MLHSPSSPRSPLPTSLEKITPPKNLSQEQKQIVFDHLYSKLAGFRNNLKIHADMEVILLEKSEQKDSTAEGGLSRGGLGEPGDVDAFAQEYNRALNDWAQDLLQKVWVACCEGREDDCPILDPYADTSTSKTEAMLPARADLGRLLNTILFLHLTTSEAKQYSALMRAFFSSCGYSDLLDETAISWTLQNPEEAVREVEAQKQAKGDRTNSAIDAVKASHAAKSSLMRNVGIGLGAVAGGVLVGVTGGLAAPLVGAGIASIFGFFGLGGTIIGLLATGLAGSGVVCGALFGVYGAKSTAEMVERHTREVRDLKILPVRTTRSENMEGTLAVRLCVSGWLNVPSDVTAPWTIFDGDDTYGLQWEIEALEALSNALVTLIKSEAMNRVKGEIIKRTMFAALMSSLAPIALLKVGQIIDNPWMNAKALAIKTGAVLGELIAKRVFGNRPVTLVGYSLGSLVIFEALHQLADLPPSETIHLVQDVFLFGTPASTDPDQWSTARRVVAGRVVNGYAKDDYVLGVLSRASAGSWSIAGLEPVDVRGVENILCEEVKGHLQWRSMVGKCLEKCNAPGIIAREVDVQARAPIPEEDPKGNGDRHDISDCGP